MSKLQYLVHRRYIIAIDEWGWYAALALLLFASFYHLICLVPFFIVLVYGGLCVLKSYKSFWELEDAWLKIIEEEKVDSEISR
jgi:hypothetical protein